MVFCLRFLMGAIINSPGQGSSYYAGPGEQSFPRDGETRHVWTCQETGFVTVADSVDLIRTRSRFHVFLEYHTCVIALADLGAYRTQICAIIRPEFSRKTNYQSSAR